MAKEDRENSHVVPRVGVLVETAVGPGRDILRGIARYVRESGPWALHLEARPQIFVEGWEAKWMKNWKMMKY